LEKLKRALIGGSLSGGLAGISLLVTWLAHSKDSYIPFAWPYFYSGLLGFNSGTLSSALVAFLLWFFLGAGLAYFVNNSQKAVKLWLLPFGLAFLFSFLIWVILMKFTSG